jgi:hypothetical protein
MRTQGLAILAVLMASNASAADLGCKKNPNLTGQCRFVWGSLGLSADAWFTLGTDSGRTIIIRPAPHSREDISERVINRLLRAQDQTREVEVHLHGRFEICPIPPEKNNYAITQYGCVASGSHLSIDSRR